MAPERAPVAYPGPRPNPGPWNIKKAFEELEKKLEEIKNPKLKLAVIDLWVGWLFELRAGIGFREAYAETKKR